ncbi:MAG: ECF-type sigma factor [Oscillospiraceae bacterium]|nr:ECF-type sigma factor [Oscillospiraceae bacterium]
MKKKTMTRERLEKFYDRRVEISELIERIADEPDTNRTWDVILDGSNGSPRPRTIVGDVENAIKKRLKSRLEKLEQQMVDEIDDVMDFIESLGDSRDRQVLTIRYIDGASIKETAKKVRFSESTVKQLLRNILKQLEK